METKNIVKAIIQVMNEVKSIDKGMTVGTGNYAYKGVADKDVKVAIGQAMQKAGLAIIPLSVDPNIQIDRWEENGKQKQSVFTEVRTKYLLLHESGESLELSGYGHGTDTQDKAAGKATTYALKYALLYTFLVPTGNIDDADTDHSNDKPTPPAKKQYDKNIDDGKIWLNPNDKNWANVKKALKDGFTLPDIQKKYKFSNQTKEQLLNEIEL